MLSLHNLLAQAWEVALVKVLELITITHYFFSPSDVIGTQIIPFRSTGIENYSLWYRSMRVALLGRNKLGLANQWYLQERSLSKKIVESLGKN